MSHIEEVLKEFDEKFNKLGFSDFEKTDYKMFINAKEIKSFLKSSLLKCRLDTEKRVREETEKPWQDMCEKFVGCSMLADEFENEPHTPEIFGSYIENLIEQIEDKS
jgi:hypothetical protein